MATPKSNQELEILETLVKDTLKDPIFTLFMNEVKSRGLHYFNILSNFPVVTGEGINASIVEKFIRRLVINPSLVSFVIEFEGKINDSLNDFLFSSLSQEEIMYLNDFLDDIVINVRMINPELYELREQTLTSHLVETMAKEAYKKNPNLNKDAFNNLVTQELSSVSHRLMAMYYLV